VKLTNHDNLHFQGEEKLPNMTRIHFLLLHSWVGSNNTVALKE